ncbi:hypothetical protein ACTVZO_43090 [Streptomyces sp. IBSNAI002]|uniref:hypothetical protein n=1 Tax=Streptomyces sp. IBSNAI002 TaxID=3457500 RepID=UPI003FCF9B63
MESDNNSKMDPPVGSKRRLEDVEKWDEFEGTPLDPRLPQDVWRQIYNKVTNEDSARLRGIDQSAQQYFAPVTPGQVRSVYTQAGFAKALRSPGVEQINLCSKDPGDQFILQGHYRCSIVAKGQSQVTVNGGRIWVNDSANVTARNARVICESGTAEMIGGSGKITGGVLTATDPSQPLDCSGGLTYCRGAAYTANVTGGTFHSQGTGTVNVSGEAEVFAAGGTVRATGGTVQAQGPAIVYASAGTVWAHSAARIEATGTTNVAGEACLIKATGTAQVTARAGTTVIATDNVIVDADDTCTVYTVGDFVEVRNGTSTPVHDMNSAGVDFIGW